MLIDDDQIFNFIHHKVIEQINNSIPIITFQSSQTALIFFETKEKNDNANEKTLVFLDINMPFLNGFELIEKVMEQNCSTEHLVFYVVSSTLNEKEIERATAYELVKGFYSKPLTAQIITEILTAE